MVSFWPSALALPCCHTRLPALLLRAPGPDCPTTRDGWRKPVRGSPSVGAWVMDRGVTASRAAQDSWEAVMIGVGAPLWSRWRILIGSPPRGCWRLRPCRARLRRAGGRRDHPPERLVAGHRSGTRRRRGGAETSPGFIGRVSHFSHLYVPPHVRHKPMVAVSARAWPMRIPAGSNGPAPGNRPYRASTNATCAAPKSLASNWGEAR
jgi:hypothetical protein